MAVQLELRAGSDISSIEVAAKCLGVDASTSASASSVCSATDASGAKAEYTNAVLRFLAAKAGNDKLKGAACLYGNTASGDEKQARAEIDSWLDFCQKEIGSQLEQAGGSSPSGSATTFAFNAQCLAVLETQLAARPFLVGESVSLADIAVACELGEAALQDTSVTPDTVWMNAKVNVHPNLSKWYAGLLKSEAAAALVDTLCLVHDAYGARVKELKQKKAGKEELQPALDKLLKLKKLGGAAAPPTSSKKDKDFKPDDRKQEQNAEAGGAGGSLGSIKEEEKKEVDPEKEAKKAAKKAEKEAKEAAKKAAKEAREAEEKAKREAKMGPKLQFTADFFEKAAYGNVFMQSQAVTGRSFFDLDTLGSETEKEKDASSGKKVWVRCRAHNVRKPFLELRQNLWTVQAIADASKTGKELVDFVGTLPRETVLDVYGELVTPQTKIKGCSIHNYELNIEKVYALSKAKELPFQLVDATRSDGEILENAKQRAAELKAGKSEKEAIKPYGKVTLDTRLNNRVLDLRTVTNQAILRLQSGVCTFFRQFLLEKGFVEIHSPKMIAQASEGGAEVFEVKYFPKYGLDKAYLAQSPQLYKQMALMTDLPRVFEIGPVFRSVS